MSNSRKQDKKEIQSFIQNNSLLRNERKYKHIPYDARVKLIDMVVNQGYAISKAAGLLGIKLSTGKFIVSSYRKKGHIMKRKEENLIFNNTKKYQEIPKRAQIPVVSFIAQLYPYPMLYYYPFF